MRRVLLSLLFLPGAAMAAAPAHTVVQKGRAFRPTEVTINRDEGLTFTNEDSFIHQIYVDGLFDSEEKAPGNLSQNRHLPSALPYSSHHAHDSACEIGRKSAVPRGQRSSFP